jgi:sec-independent protein translocase protein TatA
MFELGLPELFVIGGAALLVFGPKRLPELAKTLGKGMREFKKAINEDEVKSVLPPGTLPQSPRFPKAPESTIVASSASRDGDTSPSPQS